MKKSSYMTRAMQARDPRFATVLGKLGYERADLHASESASPVLDIKELRAEYQKVVGKRAFNGWDADTITAKIAEARG